MAAGAVNSLALGSNAKTLYVQIGRYAIGLGVPAVVSALFTAIFTRLFNAEIYGAFAVTYASVTLLSTLLGQWLQQPLARYLSGASEDEANELLSASRLGLFLISVLLVVVAAGIPLLAPIHNPLYAKFWFPASLLLWLQLLFTASTSVLQARMVADLFARVQVVLAVGRITGGLLLYFFVAKDSVVLMWGNVIATLIATYPALKLSGLGLPTFRLKRIGAEVWTKLGEMAHYGMPLMGWFIASSALATCDRLIIASLRGSSEAGIYSANYQLVNGSLGLITAPIISATWPLLLKAWNQGDTEEAGKWLGTIASWVASGGLIFSGLVALLADDIAAICLGRDFRQGAAVMPTVVAGMSAWALSMYAHKPFEFFKRTRLMMLLAMITAVLNAALNLAFVPRYGYMASAWATLFCYVFYCGVAVFIGRRWLRWKWEPRALLLAFAGAVSGYVVGGLLSHRLSGAPAFVRLVIMGLTYMSCVTVALAAGYPRAAASVFGRIRMFWSGVEKPGHSEI